MLTILDRLLSARPPIQVGLLSLLLVVIVGAFDLMTGHELSFSVFYALPISLGSWYAGRRIGFIICAIAAVTWLIMDYLAGHTYSHPGIAIWNAAVRLAFFGIIASTLSRLRDVLHLQILLAQRDGLTGIMNGAAFRHECDSVFKLSSRHRHPVALCYLDLDNFKGVNDRFGHNAGDQLLKTIAGAIRRHLRETDFCARLGGDEFAILLPETDLAGARKAVTHLHQGLIHLINLNNWPVGFSIGVAVFNPPTVGTDDAIRYADGLMYRVKASGKNSILFEEVNVRAGGC